MALRSKHIAAFGSACYMSEVSTFDCFYEEWKAACADAVKIAEVYGAAPFDKGYTCQPVGNGDCTLQVGPDIALKITINYQAAPRQTPLIEIEGFVAQLPNCLSFPASDGAMWEGDLQRGAIYNDDGCGAYEVVAWTEAGIVGLAYEFGWGPLEQLGLSVDAVTGGCCPCLLLLLLHARGGS